MLLSTFLPLNMYHYNTTMPTVLFGDHASVIWRLGAVTELYTPTNMHTPLDNSNTNTLMK